MPVDLLKIDVKTAYMNEEVLIEFAKYANGRTAIRAYSTSGEPAFTATVNIPEAVPGEGCVFLKGWAENEGIPEALVKAGVVTLTGRKIATGMCAADEAKIIVPVK